MLVFGIVSRVEDATAQTREWQGVEIVSGKSILRGVRFPSEEITDSVVGNTIFFEMDEVPGMRGHYTGHVIKAILP